MRSFHHENTRKCCTELSELFSEKTTDVFYYKRQLKQLGTTLFIKNWRIWEFFIPKEYEKDGKDENVVLSCFELSSKNYGRFVIKDNEDNLGQLFYHEKDGKGKSH